MGVVKGELPPGASSVENIDFGARLFGSRAEVDAVLAELLPGYQSSSGLHQS